MTAGSDLPGATFSTHDRESSSGKPDIPTGALLDATFESTTDAVFVVKMSEREIVRCNSSAAEMFGYTRDEIIGSNIQRLHVDETSWRDFDEYVLKSLNEQRQFHGEYELRRADGSTFPTEHMISFVGGDGEQPTHAVSIVRDISEHRRALESIEQHRRELQERTLCDGLTGLPNRTQLRTRLDHAVDRVDPAEHNITVVFVDLIRLQVVNNTLGRAAGDELLTIVADRLEECVDECVTVGRFGADEFVLLCEADCERSAIDDQCRRIVKHLTDPCEVAGTVIHPNISVGIAQSGPNICKADELLRYADVALSRAQSDDGTSISWYDPESDTQFAERLHRENALREAVASREFVLRYQPVMDLTTGDPVGVEALVRWDHPERGIVSPAEFLPLAEETGLIVPIGYQVLEQAANQTAEWIEALPPRDREPTICMSVNLSPTQYRAPDVVDRIAGIVDDSGMPMNCLMIEITENILVTGDGKLEPLRDRGAGISIDDFGTGYASLQYLRRLDADELKIDRSFVRDMHCNERDRILLESMLELGDSCDLEVIVEGIETAEQLEMLVEMGAARGQGYHYTRPVSAEEFGERYIFS
jgi:diguanylate cyclase (GGDEF)-like protein/PAS domain S-box-containing protein